MFEITKEKTRSRRFMVSTRNSNAMAEVIYYLKGIRAEDIEKIPNLIDIINIFNIQIILVNYKKQLDINFSKSIPFFTYNAPTPLGAFIL